MRAAEAGCKEPARHIVHITPWLHFLAVGAMSTPGVSHGGNHALQLSICSLPQYMKLSQWCTRVLQRL